MSGGGHPNSWFRSSETVAVLQHWLVRGGHHRDRSAPIKDYSRQPTLVVADIIGPTLHPQGPAAGRRCSVIQLGGCNLTCSWCDSAFAWDVSRYDLARKVGYWSCGEVVERALASNPSLVVLSGGEPLLQQNSEGWSMLLDALRGLEIGIETNGTIAALESTLERVDWITVSPKLAHSGDPVWARINGEILLDWGRRAQTFPVDFSFAVRDVSDVETARSLVLLNGLPPERVWIVPEGTTRTTLNLLDDVSDAAMSAGFNFSVRLSALGGGQPAETPAEEPVAARTTPLSGLRALQSITGRRAVRH